MLALARARLTLFVEGLNSRVTAAVDWPATVGAGADRSEFIFVVDPRERAVGETAHFTRPGVGAQELAAVQRLVCVAGESLALLVD